MKNNDAVQSTEATLLINSLTNEWNFLVMRPADRSGRELLTIFALFVIIEVILCITIPTY